MQTRNKLSLCLLPLVLAGACGTSNDDKDATAGEGGTKDGPAIDASTPDTTPDSAPAATKYAGLMIVDKEESSKANCGLTNGPGSDIDAVELWSSAGALIGVGRKGSAAFGAGTTSCAEADCAGGACKYAVEAFKSRTEGPRDGEVKAVGDDAGYFSLNGGRVLLQIGNATGDGSAQEITKGMSVKIWEVDQGYPKDLKAPLTCKCVPERYEVYALKTLDSNTGAVLLKPKMYITANADTCGTVSSTNTSGCGTSEFAFPTD